jgi:hypothetical protein
MRRGSGIGGGGGSFSFSIVEGHHPTAWWNLDFLLSFLFVDSFHATAISLVQRNSVNPYAVRDDLTYRQAH